MYRNILVCTNTSNQRNFNNLYFISLQKKTIRSFLLSSWHIVSPDLIGSMTKAERTRQFIIEKSAPIFNTKGYENTSMADIQEATKLSRGAIYGNFVDKNELAMAAFRHNCALSFKRADAAAAQATTAKDKLLTYTNQYAQNWQEVLKRSGCPMLNAAVEADDYLHFLRDAVREMISQFIKKLQLIIEQGQATNEFKTEIDAEKYAAFMFSVIEGSIMLAKIMNDPKYLLIAHERVSFVIEQELA